MSWAAQGYRKVVSVRLKNSDHKSLLIILGLGLHKIGKRGEGCVMGRSTIKKSSISEVKG